MEGNGMGIGPRLTRALAIQLACMPVGALAAPNFTPLGDFAGGNFDSHAAALSADGTSVVGYGTVAGGVSGTQMAFRWTTGTGMQPLGDLPGGANYSNAFGVNNN